MDDSITRDYITPRQLVEKYPAFNYSWLRMQLWKRNENGLHVAVRKIGKRFFIDEARFFEWVDSHGEQVDGGDQ